MRRDRMAERILGLFTSPERAAAVTGDLMEDARASGTVWFWGCVARTAFSMLGRDLADVPLFMAGLAFRGAVFALCLSLLWGLATIAGVAVFAIVWVQVRPAWLSVTGGLQYLSQIVALAGIGWVQYRTGRWMARRAGGREIAACAAYLLFGLAIGIAVGLTEPWWAPAVESFARNFHPQPQPQAVPAAWTTLDTVVSYVAIFAGAIGVRRRAPDVGQTCQTVGQL